MDTYRYTQLGAVTTYSCGVSNHLNNEVLNMKRVNKTEAYRLIYNVNRNGMYNKGVTPVFNKYSNIIADMRHDRLNYGEADDLTGQGIIFNGVKAHHSCTPLVGKWSVVLVIVIIFLICKIYKPYHDIRRPSRKKYLQSQMGRNSTGNSDNRIYISGIGNIVGYNISSCRAANKNSRYVRRRRSRRINDSEEKPSLSMFSTNVGNKIYSINHNNNNSNSNTNNSNDNRNNNNDNDIDTNIDYNNSNNLNEFNSPFNINLRCNISSKTTCDIKYFNFGNTWISMFNMNLDNMQHTSSISSSVANSNDRLHYRSGFLSKYSYNDDKDNDNDSDNDNDNGSHDDGNKINNNCQKNISNSNISNSNINNKNSNNSDKDDKGSTSVVSGLVGVKRDRRQNKDDNLVNEDIENCKESGICGNVSCNSLPYHFFQLL